MGWGKYYLELCLIMSDEGELLCLRFLQGLGAAIVSVVTKAMISDSYSGLELIEMTNYKVTLQIASMVFAPLIGGILQQLLTWHWNFILLAIYGVIGVYFTYYYLPETTTKKVFKLNKFGRECLSILNDTTFIQVTIITTLIYAVAASVSVFGSFFIQNVLGCNAFIFGIVLLILGGCYMLGSILFKNHMLKRVITNPENYLFIFSGIFILLAVLFPLNIYVFILLLAIIMFFSGYILPGIMSFALQTFKNYAGTANALYGTSIMLGVSIILTVVGIVAIKHLLFFALLYFILSGSICILLKCLKNSQQIIS